MNEQNTTINKAGETTQTKPSSSKGKLIAFAVIIVAALGAGYYFNAPELLKTALDYIQGLGAIGYVVFALLYIAACVFFLPGFILTLGGGFIYGVIKGSIIVSIASTLGAGAAFLVGRYFARGFVEQKIQGNKTFQTIDEAVAREGGKIVFLTRLSPIFPFNLINYAYGLTKVNFFTFILTSWIGMLPGTVMYVYLGSLAGDLAKLGAGEREKTMLDWGLYALGLIATLVVTFYITKIARKALRAKVDEPIEEIAE